MYCFNEKEIYNLFLEIKEISRGVTLLFEIKTHPAAVGTAACQGGRPALWRNPLLPGMEDTSS